MTAISLLCPSRGRVPLLAKSVEGLLALAAKPGEVEILVAADPDDTATQHVVLPNTRVWTAPARLGYAHLQDYYNALAGMASGEWVMLWNDDAYMQTQGWDQIITSQEPGVVWGIPCNPYSKPGDPSEFPALPAAWVKAWGHLCLAMQIDTWVNEIALKTGTTRLTDISIAHERTLDQTWSEQTHAHAFMNPEMVRARIADAATIMELLA